MGGHAFFDGSARLAGDHIWELFLVGRSLALALFLGKPSYVVEGYGRQESLVGLLLSNAR